MKKPKHIHQIDLDTPEGRELVDKIRSNLNVRVDVSGNYEIDLILSIRKDFAYSTLGNFLRQSIAKRMNFLDNQLINAINVSPPQFIKPALPKIKGLTPREVEILEKLSLGSSVKEAAYDLGMSPLTAKKHIKNIYNKLGVNKESMAVVEYLKLKGVINHSLADVQLALTQTGIIKGLN